MGNTAAATTTTTTKQRYFRIIQEAIINLTQRSKHL